MRIHAIIMTIYPQALVREIKLHPVKGEKAEHHIADSLQNLSFSFSCKY